MKKKTIKLNWINLSKIFWKDQLIFHLLALASALLNYIKDINLFSLIKEIFEAAKNKKVANISFNFLLGKIEYNNDVKSFFSFLFFYISFYCLIVFLHVSFSFYLESKIVKKIKKLIIKKAFSLEEKSYRKEQILSNLNSDLDKFSKMVFFVPNQIFYLLFTAWLTFNEVWKESLKEKCLWKNIFFWGIIFFILIAIVCCLMNYWVYKKDLNFQNSWEEVREIENCLVNNKKLIVKKGQEKEYKAKFVELIDKVAKEANKKDIIHSAALVFPSYAMIPYAEIVLSLLCLSFGYNITSFQLLSNIFSQEKKFFDRLKDYSYYFSAKERLNLLFAQKEKNEKQKNIILKEKVNRISLQNLSFSYDSNNKVLQKVDLVFEKGKINHLTGKNGFGKSTIIDLIMGVIKPDQGKIIINDHYDLQEINLTQWRKRMVYSEHSNLITKQLSVGQKQLLDINNSLAYSQDKSKEIFIFDEADNALDVENKSIFREEINKIKDDKLVILISH